jgi:hypothetical protein
VKKKMTRQVEDGQKWSIKNFCWVSAYLN